jgi:hypothetical protein
MLSALNSLDNFQYHPDACGMKKARQAVANIMPVKNYHCPQRYYFDRQHF